MNNYKKNFMPDGMIWFCSTTAFMWVLNYFWSTNFNIKDSYDIMTLAKLWKMNYWDWLDIDQIAYTLNKLEFDVIYNIWITEEKFCEWLNDPINIFKEDLPKELTKYVQWNYFIDSKFWVKFDITQTKYSEWLYKHWKILFCPWIKEEILSNQSDNVLFILWLNRFVLNWESITDDTWPGWHVVLSTWIKWEDFVIYNDDWDIKPKNYTIENVLNALTFTNKYEFLTIKYI